jgi:hypothetical protein
MPTPNADDQKVYRTNSPITCVPAMSQALLLYGDTDETESRTRFPWALTTFCPTQTTRRTQPSPGESTRCPAAGQVRRPCV